MSVLILLFKVFTAFSISFKVPSKYLSAELSYINTLFPDILICSLFAGFLLTVSLTTSLCISSYFSGSTISLTLSLYVLYALSDIVYAVVIAANLFFVIFLAHTICVIPTTTNPTAGTNNGATTLTLSSFSFSLFSSNNLTALGVCLIANTPPPNIHPTPP